MNRRNLDLVVLSDIHLGSYACYALELLEYLKSIQPEKLIINGDLCDFRESRMEKMPMEHKRILDELETLASMGTQVYLIQGNYDIGLSKLNGKIHENLQVRTQLELIIQNKRYLVIHGDMFNSTLINSTVINSIGVNVYKLLVMLTRALNLKRVLNGKSYKSFANAVKMKINKASQYIDNFEQTAAAYARKGNYDGIICGHIHIPVIKEVQVGNDNIQYLNSGDWVENMSSVEFNNQSWTIYKYMDEFLEFSLPKLVVRRKSKSQRPIANNFFNQTNPSF